MLNPLGIILLIVVVFVSIMLVSIKIFSHDGGSSYAHGHFKDDILIITCHSHHADDNSNTNDIIDEYDIVHEDDHKTWRPSDFDASRIENTVNEESYYYNSSGFCEHPPPSSSFTIYDDAAVPPPEIDPTNESNNPICYNCVVNEVDEIEDDGGENNNNSSSSGGGGGMTFTPPTPTPIPTPIIEPTVTPTPTIIIEPTITPKPKLTPTPTATIINTPTFIPTFTPMPTSTPEKKVRRYRPKCERSPWLSCESPTPTPTPTPIPAVKKLITPTPISVVINIEVIEEVVERLFITGASLR